ncbi:hypothetical protein CSUI_008829 [Cystoisospora suis]|uniref:Uncharacterized protein n=1 Tax=Cystoisospora suis TaxID=483139 RepID=A0A2C6KIF8_9APIC|nr:hypothetical protein CSUI_008829 [Cystoisospora suis]
MQVILTSCFASSPAVAGAPSLQKDWLVVQQQGITSGCVFSHCLRAVYRTRVQVALAVTG